MTRHLTALAAFALISGCQTAAKAPVHDTFTKVSDGKADSGSISSLAYGKTSKPVKVHANTYGWFQFAGNIGDDVDVWVRSTNGDAVAFVVDANDDVVGSNDDADAAAGVRDSHVTATLPADGTYYIAFRDYDYSNATFTVQLKGSGVFSCAKDSDCMAVPLAGCCDNGYLAAVNKTRSEDYDVLYACTQTAPICSHLKINDTRVAQCDFTASKCQMIQPQDIQCLGFINPNHSCPAGWQCSFNKVADAGGNCVPSTN